MKRSDFLFILIGLVLIFISLYLAFVQSYNHFYEPMLLGLFLILYPATKDKFNRNIYLKLYLCFFLMALFADLLIGVALAELWHYTYSFIFEYILLYLWVYPLGGLVMVQSFLLFYQTTSNSRRRINLFRLKFGIWLSGIMMLVLFLFKPLFQLNYFSPLLGFFMCLCLFCIINFFAEKTRQISLLRLLMDKPKQIVVAILSGTYLNAFLHEYPNLFARQWIYSSNWPFEGVTVLGTPISILIAWVFLMIGPVSAYFLVASKVKKETETVNLSVNKK